MLRCSKLEISRSVIVSRNSSRLCKLAFSRSHLATNGVEVQTVRSGVIYMVGSFLAQMCPVKAVSLAGILGCAPIGEMYVLGLLKAKRDSVPTQTSSTELI